MLTVDLKCILTLVTFGPVGLHVIYTGEITWETLYGGDYVCQFSRHICLCPWICCFVIVFYYVCWDYQVPSVVDSPVFCESCSDIGFPIGLSIVPCLSSFVLWSRVIIKRSQLISCVQCALQARSDPSTPALCGTFDSYSLLYLYPAIVLDVRLRI